MQFPGATRVFHLSEDGITCDGAGLRVGGVDLLEPDPARARGLIARPDADLNLELSLRYRLPVDVVGKSHGLNRIADALERGDLALAQIGALLLQMPDPPALGKALGGDDAWDLAMQLAASGLLKADWDETKHPRTGTPPNPRLVRADRARPERCDDRPAQAENGMAEPVDQYRGAKMGGGVRK